MTQSCQSIRGTILVLLMAVAACQPKPAPVIKNVEIILPGPQVVTRGEGPSTSSKVPSGELTGIVVDAATGAPLPQTQVIVLYNGSTLTDSIGRFRIALPKSSATIQVRRKDYIDVNTSVMYNPDSGHVAVFAIQRLEWQCWLSDGRARWPGVRVIARDVVSNESPDGIVSVVARDGDYRDSVAARADSKWALVVNAAPERPGRYAVTVRADGYRPWSGLGATRPMPNCGSQFAAATFHAWLVPR